MGEPTADADPTPVGADPTPVGEVGLFFEAAALDDTGEHDDLAAEPESARSNRGVVLAALGALVLVAAGWVALGDQDSAPAPKPDIPLDVWVPYWTLDATNDVAALRIPSMRDVSPFWFNATGVDSITVDPNADRAATEEFLAIAEDAGANIVPSIVDALPAGEMAAILADPASRAVHVETLVAFAEDGDYIGIDIDYEQFAFADGRDTWESTRPNWVSFIEELSVELRADDRTLTVSIPPVYDAGRSSDSGFWVYDYGAIAPHVDAIRIMAYDFSVGAPGPIAPLSFVERSIAGALEATGAPDKIVLGVPAYGRNWPIEVSGECDGVDVQGMTGVNARTVDDLVQRRGATPEFDPVTGEWSFSYDLTVEGTSCVQTRQVHYVDGDGVRLRMDLARQNQLAGVSLWAFGFDDTEVWDAILPTVDSSATEDAP